jgi:dTMP kinase
VSLFITMEGPEGGGKTTQSRLLAEHLRSLGNDVLLTREPGGTPIGEQIRAVLGSLDNTDMHPRTEFLLFSSSRAQLVRQVIQPHLDRGGLVVCDRFFDSSLAYQGFGHRLDLQQLRTITDFAVGGIAPDLTLLLDIPVEEGLRRREKSGSRNRLDDYDVAFHRRVRKGYQQLAAADPHRWVRIDASGPPDKVQEEVRRVVEARLREMRQERGTSGGPGR